ncbi:MAG: hypothetical protein CR972_04415 [Candidatus Moraniibacteriota bacterium]|nr:MAG: hypothetical protein CR972_04415 [Candidatus Moranbacteria bacterium]
MAEKNFVRKKVRSLTLGEKLQQLRKDHQIKMVDLSRKINVKITYISALEKGEYENLPTKVYVKGFVRSYARFFGVPEDVLLNLFEREYSIYKNINGKDEEETVNKLPKVPRFVLTPRIIFVFLGLIILFSIGVYLYFGVDNFISSPWLVVEEPINNNVVNSNVVVVQGKTRNNSKVLINGQQVFVDIDGHFSDKVGLSPGINTINVKSINKFEKESVQEIIVDAQFHVEEVKKDEEKNVHLFIKAQDKSVWVNVATDGIDVYNDTIQPEDEKKFDAAKQIKITTSSGMNTLVSYDGKKYEHIGEEDEVVKEWIYEGEKEKASEEEKDEGEIEK